MSGYNNDIQIVMDFVKLSFVLDDPNIKPTHKRNASILRNKLLEILPEPRNSQMAYIYSLLREIK